jgi:O-succinylbenzoate synthase
VGGVVAAKQIHDLCHARDIGLWIGGMFETGLGKAVDVALAALPGATLPGDLPASARWYPEDLTEPFVLEAGTLAVPTAAGIGRVPRDEVMSRRAIRSTEWAESHGT